MRVFLLVVIVAAISVPSAVSAAPPRAVENPGGCAVGVDEETCDVGCPSGVCPLGTVREIIKEREVERHVTRQTLVREHGCKAVSRVMRIVLRPVRRIAHRIQTRRIHGAAACSRCR
jgi:hypothetical protein